jgi:hypothetical protein
MHTAELLARSRLARGDTDTGYRLGLEQLLDRYHPARVLGITPLGLHTEAVENAADTLVHAPREELLFGLGPMRKHPFVINHQHVTIAHHG